MEYTNIRISKELRDELREIGKKGETYNNILNRIVKEWKNKQ